MSLGVSDSPGGAAALKSRLPGIGFRYQYLAGGVNTGNGWANWNAGGEFVRYYIQESRANGIIPVFTYYMLYQSQPGVTMGEADGVAANLNNNATMAAYYNDLKLFFQRAAASPAGTTVLHVEPDAWAYMQQRSSNPANIPVRVGGSGQADVAGLPNNAAGFAQAIVRLRDRYAPTVTLGYHYSVWSSGQDIIYSDPSDSVVATLGTSVANFYKALNARFDVAFHDLTDRDAAFKQYVYGDGGRSWYNANDYRRSTIYVGAFGRAANLRTVIWQIPFGNTKMRAQNNTWDHYQDNKVEWLLDEPARTHLKAYADAGVVAFLFGRGAGGATCACDAAGDGVTNPPAINGNTRPSINADDDGGYFKEKARAYLSGPMVLPGGS
ncbi:MAG: hypothetical protein ABWZ52_08760 [Acidimicrobiales bacterium]